MSATKRLYFPEIYAELPILPDLEQLKEQAKKAICACYFWDLCNSLDDMTAEDLLKIINTPYSAHIENDHDITECPEYQAEQCEILRDQHREDGINV